MRIVHFTFQICSIFSLCDGFLLDKQSSTQLLKPKSKISIFNLDKNNDELVALECNTSSNGPCTSEEVNEIWPDLGHLFSDEFSREEHVYQVYDAAKHPCKLKTCDEVGTLAKKEKEFTFCECVCEKGWGGEFCEIEQ